MTILDSKYRRNQTEVYRGIFACIDPNKKLKYTIINAFIMLLHYAKIAMALSIFEVSKGGNK